LKISWEKVGLHPQQKVLIGCSGGVDSMVLLHSAVPFFPKIGAVYIHHGWRKKGDQEMEHVRRACEELHVPFHFEEIPPSHWEDFKGSWELEARELRYQIFQRIVDHHGYDRVLLGHHRDDVVETVIMNQLRGTGLSGMKGIPPIREPFARPLMDFSKKELIHFAQKNGIFWMEDESNNDTRFLRNSIRHRLIPILEEIQPHAVDSIARNAWFMGLQNDLMNELVDEKLPLQKCNYGFFIDLSGVKSMKNAPMLLFMVLRRYGFSLEQCADVLAHVGQKNVRWHSKNWQVVVVDQILQLGKFPSEEVFFEGTLESWNENDGTPINGIVDHQKQLIIRSWKAGDRMEYATGKHKKVSDFLPSKGVYGLEKDGVLVVECEGKLIAVGALWVHADWR
jgi:tRNA(Ile)-lysidine synthase